MPPAPPAIADFPTTTTTSSSSLPRNPRKGEFPSDPSLSATIFMANPHLGLGPGAPTPTSSAHGGTDSTFPPAPPRRACRLVKVRRHSGSSRAKPPPPPPPAAAAEAAAPLHEELRGWNPFSSGSGSAGNGGDFVFTAGSGAGLGARGEAGSGAGLGARGEAGSFVFSSGANSGASEQKGKENPVPGEKANHVVGNSSSVVFGQDSRKSSPELNVAGLERRNAENMVFVFGYEKGATSNGVPVQDPGTGKSGATASFVFGSMNGLRHFEEGSPKLPDKMSKLHLRSSGNDDDIDKAKQADRRGRTEKSGSFVFGANINAPSMDNGIEANVLPEKMTQLNIGCEPPSQSMKSENGNRPPEVFVFGSNVTTSFVPGQTVGSASCSVHDAAVNVLPEKMTNLNIGSAMPSQSTENGSVIQPPGVFVFGSEANKSPSSRQTASMPFTSFSSCASSEPPSNSKGLSNEGLRNPTSSGPNVFVFGSNSAGQFEGDAVNMLHDDIKKLNISREEGISAGHPRENDASTSVKFSFETKASTSSKYGAVAQPKVQEPFEPTTPLNPSSSHPSFQNGSTDFGFRSMHGGAEAAPRGFCTVNQDAPGLSTESLFGLHYIKTAYRDKKGEHTSARKKKTNRMKQPDTFHQYGSKQVATSRSEEAELKSPGGSPMDCSPYPAAAEQGSREASLTSDESIPIYSDGASDQKSGYVEEDLVSATEHLVIDGDHHKHEDDCAIDNAGTSERNVFSSPSNIDAHKNLPSASRPGFENTDVGNDVDIRTAVREAKADYCVSNIEGQTSDGNTKAQANEDGGSFAFAPSSANFSGLDFTFSAEPPAQNSVSEPKHHRRRKFRMKGGQSSPPSNQSSIVSNSMDLNASQDVKGMPSSPQGVETRRTQDSRKEQVKTDASIAAALEACETWRIRGNQAYANGHFAKAEEHYTRGIKSINRHGSSICGNRPLMLCYSNRAATRMSLGRMRDALKDCAVATSIDPSFLKAKVRAANCQLALGDIEDALKSYTGCLQSSNIAGLDPKIFREASDGVERAQKVADLISQSKELLKKRTSTELTRALELVSNALSISSHSDNLMEMKAEALLMLRMYDEVIQLCEETTDLAERNSVLFGADGNSEQVECPARLWRSYFISKSYFYLGKLEEALVLLKKYEQVKSAGERYGNTSPERFSSLSATVNQLLHHKVAGNEAFQAGRYSEAVEQYTSALACNSESRPFSAICFCNRAAAYQALGQVTDAIADCSLAIVLDANYPKAISRRATLYEMIRDYAQAANDLRKLISLLERSVNSNSDLNRARARLSFVEDEARKETPLNLYLILGIEPCCSVADVKKAYRKAALRHHPDKAAQFLARNENADDGLWRDIAREIHAHADHLFKTIGEAYNVLSDPNKRLEYDTEEEVRNTMKKHYNYNGSSTRRSPEGYNSKHFGKSSSPHQWRSYRSSNHERWSGSSSSSYW